MGHGDSGTWESGTRGLGDVGLGDVGLGDMGLWDAGTRDTTKLHSDKGVFRKTKKMLVWQFSNLAICH